MIGTLALQARRPMKTDQGREPSVTVLHKENLTVVLDGACVQSGHPLAGRAVFADGQLSRAEPPERPDHRFTLRRSSVLLL